MARHSNARAQLFQDIDQAVSEAAADLETLRNTVAEERARLQADTSTPNGSPAAHSEQ